MKLLCLIRRQIRIKDWDSRQFSGVFIPDINQKTDNQAGRMKTHTANILSDKVKNSEKSSQSNNIMFLPQTENHHSNLYSIVTENSHSYHQTVISDFSKIFCVS